MQHHATRSGTSYAKNRQAQIQSRDWVEDNKNVRVQKWKKQVAPHNNFKAPKWIKTGAVAEPIQQSQQQEDMVDEDSYL